MNAKATLLVLGALAATVANAQSQYNYVRNGSSGSPAGGTINLIDASFNTITNRLTWNVNFSNVPGTSQKTEGFWLVVSNGPNPKGTAGQLAIFYMDATGAAPKLTAYGYNGVNGSNSYNNGNGGGGAPDRIASSLISGAWINSLTKVDHADGTRTLGFDIDATAINNRVPHYGNAADWEGAKWGPQIGVWFHQVAGLSTSYDNGFLSNFSYQNAGWHDTSGETTQPVPEPATLAAVGLGLVGALRRRKKA